MVILSFGCYNVKRGAIGIGPKIRLRDTAECRSARYAGLVELLLGSQIVMNFCSGDYVDGLTSFHPSDKFLFSGDVFHGTPRTGHMSVRQLTGGRAGKK